MGKFAAYLTARVERWLNLQTLFFAGVVGLTLYLVLVPLAFLIWSSFHTAASPFEAAPLGLKNYAVAYLDPATYQMLYSTFWFALGSVAIGLSLGVAFAWLLERTNIPLKNLLYTLVPLPMIIPGMLSAIGWILILSPRIGIVNLFFKHFLGMEKALFNIYTMGGMYFVQGIRMVPSSLMLQCEL